MKPIVAAALAAALAGAGQAQDPPPAREQALRALELRALELHALTAATAQVSHRIEAELAMHQALLASPMADLELQLATAGTHLQMALLGPELSAARLAVASHAGRFGEFEPSWSDRLDELQPEFRSLPQDPADSLYRAGRERLNAREWERAAELFRRIRSEQRFASSGYRADAHYWEAFALAQRGGEDELRRAREVLTLMRESYPEGEMIRDAARLATEIDGRLARRGDPRAAEALYRAAELSAIQQARRVELSAVQHAELADRLLVESTRRSRGNAQCPEDEQDDIRIAALSALLNVDSDRTVPVLREVLQRRDECSAPLRRRALMLLHRSSDPEAAQVLIDAARNDPDEGVREQAVLFLGNLRTPEAEQALRSMLAESTDPAIQRRALTALTQRGGAETTAMLRDFATRADADPELRRYAIMLLMAGRGGDAVENRAFLRDLFARTDDEETRTAILHSLASDRSREGVEWLMGVATSTQATPEQKRQALFMAAQTEHVTMAQLARLYDQATDSETREQLLFVIARRDEPEAFDKLVSIARSDSDLEVRRRAVFWIGQSKDPRAPDVLLELIR